MAVPLTVKHLFWKTKTFFKKLEFQFLLGSTTIENAALLPCQKTMLRHLE